MGTSYTAGSGPRWTNPMSQHLDEERIGEEEACLGERRSPVLLEEEAPLLPGVQEVPQPAGFDRDPLLDPCRGNAVARAQAEDEAFGEPLPRRERLVAGHRKLLPLGERAIPLDRVHVDIADVSQKA